MPHRHEGGSEVDANQPRCQAEGLSAFVRKDLNYVMVR